MSAFRSILGDTAQAVFDNEERAINNIIINNNNNFSHWSDNDESSVTRILAQRILETSVVAANMQFTDQQRLVLMIIQRISGGISILGGLYMFQRAWKRTHCAFDRIMLSLSMHTILWGIYHLWGSAAMPIGTPDVDGAHGNSTTCTIQGFLFQISMTIPFYYVFLSCYSWAVIVQGTFDPARYEWIEKYIHVGVHIFPLGSAIYLQTIEAFNPNGLHCWIASIPAGCGEGTGIECTRGPQNPDRIKLLYAGIPAIFLLAFPTILMTALVIVVYRKQRNGSIPPVITASMVARQSVIYLGSLYWVYLPLFVFNGVIVYNHSSTFGFAFAVWVSSASVSLGLWFAMVYKYFSSSGKKEPSAFSCEDLCVPNPNKLSTITHRSTGITTTAGIVADDDDEGADVFDANNTSTSNHSGSNGLQEGSSSRSLRSKKSGQRWNLNTNAAGVGVGVGHHHTPASSRATQQRFSFNIFDGTASSGKYAAFIFDGDSEDEEKDGAESRLWAGCQNIINDE